VRKLRFKGLSNGILGSALYRSSRKLLFYRIPLKLIRRVWRYQRGNQNPYIEEKQITQWPKETVQMDKQRSTKHTHKTKDRI